MANLPLGWMQLRNEPLRLVVALCGVGFAVVLVLMQLGFRESMFESSLRYHRALRYDIVLLSPKSPFIVQLFDFPRQRVVQARGVPGVTAAVPVYVRLGLWKHPDSAGRKFIFAVAFDPSHDALALEGVEDRLELLKQPDVLLYDALSRPEYGPIAERYREGGRFPVEMNGRRMHVDGLFELGTSFGIDGSVVMSDVNYLRVFPERNRDQVELGLVRIAEGADAGEVAAQLRRQLPGDVTVLTKRDYIQAERDYWDATTPIGYVLGFGLVVGLVVGAIIVYQILFADVCEHEGEYATLKAMGYSNVFLARVVLQQALILAVLGYIPGLLISTWLYGLASSETRLPLVMTTELAGLVLVLAIVMCSVSGLMALRKIWMTDPAEVF